MKVDLTIEPPCDRIPQRAAQSSRGAAFGQPLERWRAEVRRELGLAADRPIIATGHQTLLWHPGILAKYLLCESVARLCGLATANLVVDQHADGFGDFDVPVRQRDGALAVRRIELCQAKRGVPMGRHEPCAPPPAPALAWALPSVGDGANAIVRAVEAHQGAPNAALQMARALADLMSPWVSPMPHVTATDLIGTSLAKAMLQAMVDDPQRCAQAYNRAVASVPDAGIAPLLLRGDSVELPLWRVGEGGIRQHAYDSDAARHLEAADVDLLPRAIFMTALVRLAMCDVYIHGTGGARYDRAMELWMRDWLQVEPCAVAIATANLRLPLLNDDSPPPDVDRARWKAHQVWHDPANRELDGASPEKRQMLASIDALPRNSRERRAAFVRMHERLDALRHQHEPEISRAQQEADSALRRAGDFRVAQRRDWAFPLYPQSMIDALAGAIAERLECLAPSAG